MAGYQTWGAAGQPGWVPNLGEQPDNAAGYQTWGSSWAMRLGTKPGGVAGQRDWVPNLGE